MPPNGLHPPTPGTYGHTRMKQSLRGYVCPGCKGDLVLGPDGVNRCPGSCGHEFITEWEYERRQRAAQTEAA